MMAAHDYGAKGYGIELIEKLVNIANKNAVLLGLVDDVKIIRGNIFDINLSSADVITMYLLKNANEKVRVKLEKELKSGARIVTLNYPIANWKYNSIYKIGDEKHRYTIYLYIWKANVVENR